MNAVAPHANDVYAKEIVDVLDMIQAWFAGAANQDSRALDALMARFSPQFSMITPSGAVLDLAGLRALFERIGGQRSGLEITISGISTLAVNASGATMCYHERQTMAGVIANDRRATAVFEMDAQGRLLWRHLHETFCA